MENQNVTLTISTDKNETLLFTYNVLLFKEETTQLQEYKKIEYNGESELFLGTINELKDFYLIFEAFAQKANDYDNSKLARINYEIKYGEKTVQKQTIESHFINKGPAFLGFRFRFCPRYPFC